MSNLATIQTIKSLEKIENADKILLAKLDGLAWQVVVKKGEFVVGEMVIFVETDTILPNAPWSQFLKDKNQPDKPIRLKSIKLRGVLSQGLVLGLDEVCVDRDQVKIGQDFAEGLGIKKYEKPIPAELNGEVVAGFPTNIIPITDQKNIQNFPHILEDYKNELFYCSIKYDGCSATFYSFDGHFGVCGRNWEYKDDNKTLWKLAKKYELDKYLADCGNFAIQCECVGPGVNGNKYGFKEHDVYVFDVYDIDNRCYLDPVDMQCFAKGVDMKLCERVFEGMSLYRSMDDMLAIADGTIKVNGVNRAREGLVFKSMVEKRDYKMGRLSFKAKSNKYSLKNKE